MTEKQFYSGYIADSKVDEVDLELVELILNLEPESVFEFGAGSGKNLKLLKDVNPDIETWAIDISILNVVHCKLNGVDCAICGDERHLPLRKFDIVFTCSVLDHIQEIGNIIGHFQQIATKGIILAETNSFEGDYYWRHDYESHGFEKLDYKHYSEDDGGIYEIWYMSAERIAAFGAEPEEIENY